MAETKKTTAKKATSKVVKKTGPKKTATKKVAVKKASTAPKASKKPSPSVEQIVKESALRPTTYAEVGRIYRSTISSVKGTVVFTSAQSGEGVSLVSHLMAQRCAESGSKTLLIDLNLKNKKLTQGMAVAGQDWSLPARHENDPLVDLIHPMRGVAGLYFMSAPQDLETVLFLKDEGNARAFFKALEEQYDHVIVDTTPIGALNRGNVDPIVLSVAAQCAVVVMQAAVTPRRMIARTIDQLRDAGAHVSGVVVNDQKNPTLKRKLLAFVNSFQCVAPGLSDWLRHKVLHHPGLN